MKRALPIAILALVGLTLSTPALSGKRNKKAEPEPAAAAEAKPEAEPADGPHAAVVAYRHNLLEGVAKHFGLSKMIVMGEVERSQDLVGHAKAIEASFADFATMFPEGSGPDAYPQTDSLPTIWSDWAGFETAIAKAQTEAAAFTKLAEAGDMGAAKAQLLKVGAACGGCHKTFRKDED